MSIIKNIDDVLTSVRARLCDDPEARRALDSRARPVRCAHHRARARMRAAAANLEFERAAQSRDRLKRLRRPGGAAEGR